jgi:hypothetical protein
MKRSIIRPLGAALGVLSTRTVHSRIDAPHGDECPVCDYPFASSAHFCLASDSGLVSAY